MCLQQSFARPSSLVTVALRIVRPPVRRAARSAGQRAAGERRDRRSASDSRHVPSLSLIMLTFVLRGVAVLAEQNAARRRRTPARKDARTWRDHPPITPVPMAWRLRRSRTRADDERQTREHERERGHQDRPQAQARGFERGRRSGCGLAPAVFSDSTIRIAFLVERPMVARAPTLKQMSSEARRSCARAAPQHAERHDEDNRYGYGPAFIENRETQEHDDHRNRVQDRSPASTEALLIGLSRPVDAKARGQLFTSASTASSPGPCWRSRRSAR